MKSGDARGELVKLRTGLVRLAMRAGLAEHIPGAPARDTPFEELTRLAEENERGWNALIARLMDRVNGCEHCEFPEAHEPSHEPGCELVLGIRRSGRPPLCSCLPYNMEG